MPPPEPTLAALVDLPWLAAWGWRLRLELDALGGLYALLAAGVAVPVLAYSAAYLPGHLRDTGQPRSRAWAFYGWMALFLASMIGLALAGDLILLLVFFDLTAVCSWALIGFDRDREARGAALTALLVTGIPSVGFLIGVVLLQARFGTLGIAELTERAAGDPAALVPLALILVAALAKSAQWPLHFWLPRAMAAPTPVSAYLHSAAMVAAGVFVLHRLHALLVGPALGEPLLAALTAAGWLSIFAGSGIALAERGLKRILAGSTIAHYGHVAVLLGHGGFEAAAAAAVYVAVHAVAKSALFLVAGAVTRATGAHELGETGGLGRRMPGLAAAAGIAAAALAGAPLTAGFFKDEAAFGVLARDGGWAVAGGVAALALTATYMWRFWSGLFLAGEGVRAGRGAVRPVPRLLTAAPALLAVALLAAGLSGAPLAEAGANAAEAVHGPELAPLGERFELAYHLDLRLTNRMALAAWLLGAGLAASRRRWRPALARAAERAARWGPATLWDRGLVALDRLADRLHLIPLRDLRDRVAAVLVPAGGLIGLAIVAGPGFGRYELGAGLGSDLPLAAAVVAAAASAVAAVIVRSHLGLVLLVSAVGYSMAAVFALLGAPDVALVALLVETALTLLFVAALARLPGDRVRRERGRGLPELGARWHAAAAVASGALAAAVAWAGLSSPADETVATRHVELAGEAHAGNVVAAILADFRGLDTLGEATVVVAALLGVASLVGGPPARERSRE